MESVSKKLQIIKLTTVSLILISTVASIGLFCYMAISSYFTGWHTPYYYVCAFILANVGVIVYVCSPDLDDISQNQNGKVRVIVLVAVPLLLISTVVAIGFFCYIASSVYFTGWRTIHYLMSAFIAIYIALMVYIYSSNTNSISSTEGEK